MKPAIQPTQRPKGARLLVVGADGAIHHRPRHAFADELTAADVLVANDAATIPASLAGVHTATGEPIELRLAARSSLHPDDLTFTAVLFGAGDYLTPTEARPPPPPLSAGEVLAFGELKAEVLATLGHPRLLRVVFDGGPNAVWAAIAARGRPVQYAYMRQPLAIWDVWTPIAGPPVAFEPPSAGFMLDWGLLQRLRQRGVAFAALTHAAGLSSTGDAVLDARFPLPEAYRIPAATVRAIDQARAQGGRVIAVGTTVTRALEHAAGRAGGLRAGEGLADQQLGPDSALRVVDAILSGTHEPGASHYDLLGAFAGADVLSRADAELEASGYLTHEFGDSVLVWRGRSRSTVGAAA